MEFVNSIAKIVHMETSLHGGFPNKNIGDAFLLVRAPLSHYKLPNPAVWSVSCCSVGRYMSYCSPLL